MQPHLVTPVQTWPVASKTALKQAILVRLGDIVSISSSHASRVMVDFFASESTQVLQQLEQRPELQFQYLRSVLSRVPASVAAAVAAGSGASCLTRVSRSQSVCHSLFVCRLCLSVFFFYSIPVYRIDSAVRH